MAEMLARINKPRCLYFDLLVSIRVETDSGDVCISCLQLRITVAIHKRLKIVAVGLSSTSLSLVNIGENAREITAIERISKAKVPVILGELLIFSIKLFCFAGTNELFLFKSV